MMNRMKMLTAFTLSFVLIFTLALVFNTQAVSALTANESWATTPWGQYQKPRTSTGTYGYPQGTQPYGYGQGMAPGNLPRLYLQNQQPFMQAQPRYSQMTTPQLIAPGTSYAQFGPQAGYLQGAMQPYQCNSRGCQLARQNQAATQAYGGGPLYDLYYNKESKKYYFKERKAPQNSLSSYGTSSGNTEYALFYNSKTKTYEFKEQPMSRQMAQYLSYFSTSAGASYGSPWTNGRPLSYAASTQTMPTSPSMTSSTYNLYQYANSSLLNYPSYSQSTVPNTVNGMQTDQFGIPTDPTWPVVRPYRSNNDRP